MRHISFNVEPGVKYRIGGPTISARASVVIRYRKYQNIVKSHEQIIDDICNKMMQKQK